MKIENCPFCGAVPKIEHAKITYCQLHGEPAQEIIVKCKNPDCSSNPSVRAGDVYNGGVDKARQEAISKWNTRKEAVKSHEGLVNALKAIRLRSNDSSNGFLEAIYSIAEEALKAADGEV
jgi:hypothetical protein